ncbi:DnaB-like helicase C-terminal domain-containing protein [Streptomyces sp. WG7]|uniref:DnaB-like helicase C-terminal domain-containing protein n=1 Tax=Streptomyces sp. WG7 TaxID=3417650 RepID=UPI003CFB81FB
MNRRGLLGRLAGADRRVLEVAWAYEAARCLKPPAKKLDVPVVAVPRLNCGPEQRTDKHPTAGGLRDSGEFGGQHRPGRRSSTPLRCECRLQ